MYRAPSCGSTHALNRAWIEAHIPHQGRMCLLDEVIAWDAHTIRCRSGGHRAADNPLRAQGRLGIACGIEYAAQAMAVHGALAAGGSDVAPDAGFLRERSRTCGCTLLRLDDVRDPI